MNNKLMNNTCNDCIELQQENEKLKRKILRYENLLEKLLEGEYDNILHPELDLYQSILIDDIQNTDHLKSRLGDDYEVINNIIDIGKIPINEYKSIEKQQRIVQYNLIKNKFKKATIVTSIFGTVIKIGKTVGKLLILF